MLIVVLLNPVCLATQIVALSQRWAKCRCTVNLIISIISGKTHIGLGSTSPVRYTVYKLMFSIRTAMICWNTRSELKLRVLYYSEWPYSLKWWRMPGKLRSISLSKQYSPTPMLMVHLVADVSLYPKHIWWAEQCFFCRNLKVTQSVGNVVDDDVSRHAAYIYITIQI